MVVVVVIVVKKNGFGMDSGGIGSVSFVIVVGDGGVGGIVEFVGGGSGGEPYRNAS